MVKMPMLILVTEDSLVADSKVMIGKRLEGGQRLEQVGISGSML